MMDCLLAKCTLICFIRLFHPPDLFMAAIPCITDCVMAELEKLGHKYRVALRYVKIVNIVRDQKG